MEFDNIENCSYEFNSEKFTELINVKEVIYKNHTEFRFYEKPILKNIEKKSTEKTSYILIDDKQVNVSTGEIRSDKSIEHSKKSSMNRTINAIYELAFANEWEYFFTFTFNPDLVNRYNYDECYNKLSKFFNNFKLRKCPDFKYLCVPEQHKDGAFHFHALISGFAPDFLFDSGHKSYGYTVYNFPSFKFGFSTATKVSDTNKVSNYITKYITKELCDSVSKHRYLASKGLNRAEVKEHYLSSSEYEELKLDKLINSTYSKEVNLTHINQKITYIHI